MMDYKLYKRLLDNSASDDDVVAGINSEYNRLLVEALFRLIERDICSDAILKRLKILSVRLKNDKLMGAWQLGHLAMAALYFSSSKEYKKAYNNIYGNISDDDKFLVDCFIESFKKGKNN